jgi:hypothetical protein
VINWELWDIDSDYAQNFNFKSSYLFYFFRSTGSLCYVLPIRQSYSWMKEVPVLLYAALNTFVYDRLCCLF